MNSVRLFLIINRNSGMYVRIYHKYRESTGCDFYYSFFMFCFCYRHGFTVIANLIIFLVLSVLFYFDDKGSVIGPSDLRHFSVCLVLLFTNDFQKITF